jgi:YesN/AraC family two-component response regulator
MIFDGSLSEFTILDVLRIVRSKDNQVGKNNKRPIGYLSCRLSGWSEIELAEKTLRPDTEHYVLCPPYTQYTHYYGKEEVIAVHLEYTKNPPKEIELIYNTSPEIKTMFLRLHSVWTEKQPGYMLKCKSIVYDILYSFQNSEYKEMNSKIKNSMDYLYENYLSCDFSIEEMIKKSYISEAYFRRFFRKIYGCNVVELVNHMRIEHAKSLIESHRYSIRQIASMTGFSDEKYFSQVFRKFSGYAPSKYNR